MLRLLHRSTLLAAVLSMGASLEAQHPDYFPLQPDNQWVYRCSGFCPGEPTGTMEVRRIEAIDGRPWALVTSIDGAQENWLRQDESLTVWRLDRETGQESVWYRFGAGESTAYETAVDPCSIHAQIASKQAEYRGPIGHLRNALEVRYGPDACADAGIASELFVPYVGLVSRTVITIGGPRTWDLVYSRTGGVTEVSAPAVAFQLALDQTVYTIDRMPGPEPRSEPGRLWAVLRLRNTTGAPLVLEFPSGQIFEFEIRNPRGEVVHRWSDGKAFPQAIQRLTLDGETNWALSAPLTEPSGEPLPPGEYVAQGWLVHTEPGRSFRAAVPFRIEHTY